MMKSPLRTKSFHHLAYDLIILHCGGCFIVRFIDALLSLGNIKVKLMHCGGCFIVRFIDALSADLFWKQCIETGH